MNLRKHRPRRRLDLCHFAAPRRLSLALTILIRAKGGFCTFPDLGDPPAWRRIYRRAQAILTSDGGVMSDWWRLQVGEHVIGAVRRSWRASSAFGAVVLVGLVTAVLPPYGLPSYNWAAISVGLVLLVAAGALAVRAPTTHWSTAIPPLSLFVLIAAARATSGSALSGWTPLMMVPLLWIVLYGTRALLYGAAAGVALVYLVPAVVVGPPVFGWHEWRPAVLWVVVIVVLCPWVQQQVQRLRLAVQQQQLLTGRLAAVLRAATEHAIIATNLQGIITLFSPGAERMLGWDAEEIVGQVDPLVLHDSKELIRRAQSLRVPLGIAVLVNDVPNGGATTQEWIYQRREALLSPQGSQRHDY